MSKKTRIRELMLEYSARASAQSIPQGPGESSPSTSGPSIISSTDSYKQTTSSSASDKKVFDDEQRAYDDAFVMPYTLDRINDSMTAIVNGAAEARLMLDQTIENPQLNEPQVELLKRQIKVLAKIQKATIDIVHNLDSMTITTK